MSQYLSKEEIRQWRSSLEKITLEEFAARLGKVINEEKETRDIVDIVLEKDPLLVHENYKVKTEKITSIAQKAISKEREITTVRAEMKAVNAIKEARRQAAENKKPPLPLEDIISKEVKEDIKAQKAAREARAAKREARVEVKIENINDGNLKVTFKKPLTEREQMVFNHFLEHKNSIVYAKDLAALLDLPRDYVYKYIKNLRNKIEEDALENASNGGYVLKA
ncbi:helix-turn-helix domain-containing protein [bacterium]|nr:helix-turn-helix domain-containing protein [bacterium]